MSGVHHDHDLRVYHGSGFSDPGPGTVVVEPDGYELDSGYDHPDLPSHSPDGIQCGYGGSGPAQLSAALLYDVTGDAEIATTYYREFLRDVVSDLGASWTLSAKAIHAWLEITMEQAGERPGRPA